MQLTFFFLRRDLFFLQLCLPLNAICQVEEGLRPGRVAGVEGLWITGQDVTTNGFAGALMGGVVTAHGILGYGFFDLALCGRDA